MRALSAADSAWERPLLVGTDLSTMVNPSFVSGQVTLEPVVVVPKVVVPIVVVENVVVDDVVVVGGLIVIVGGCVTTPTVSVVLGLVETGIDVAGSLDFSSSVAARATTAPEMRATSKRAASAAHNQTGESRRQTSA